MSSVSENAVRVAVPAGSVAIAPRLYAPREAVARNNAARLCYLHRPGAGAVPFVSYGGLSGAIALASSINYGEKLCATAP